MKSEDTAYFHRHDLAEKLAAIFAYLGAKQQAINYYKKDKRYASPKDRLRIDKLMEQL